MYNFLFVTLYIQIYIYIYITHQHQKTSVIHKHVQFALDLTQLYFMTSKVI